MPRGGRRPGAGRPPKLEKRGETPVRVAERKIRDRLPELVDVALRMALEEGNERMLIYCIDRVLGKPTQPFDFYDAARRAAEERGLNPDRVISLYERLKHQKVS